MLAGVSAESLIALSDGSACGRVAIDKLPDLAGRIGIVMPIGNEGAGTVIAAGAGNRAQALIGQRVAVAAGGMLADYRTAKAGDCIPVPEGLMPEQCAAGWINPLTALAMGETMRREGHSGVVLTAAASSLGQMLNRLCLADGVPLVNIVRSPAQNDVLRALGAQYVCDSSLRQRGPRWRSMQQAAEGWRVVSFAPWTRRWCVAVAAIADMAPPRTSSSISSVG
jgi:NADPH:quinone reductase-like Zn-dependent oxidoreductase